MIEAWDKGTEGNCVRRSVSVIIKLIKEEAEKHDEDEDNNNKEDSKKNSKKNAKNECKPNINVTFGSQRIKALKVLRMRVKRYPDGT